MKILVVDDEPLARQRVLRLLRDELRVEEITEAENGLEAVQAIHASRPDVVLLDVQMPGLDGFGVVEAIGPGNMPVTIFVTAFDEFAVKAFDAHALDYLLKPFDPARLRHALARARGQLALRRQDDLEQRLTALLGQVQPASRYLERFIVRNGQRLTFVGVDAVDWIGAEGNYSALHVRRQIHLIRDSLGGLERKLDPRRFLRIHRSTIVNLDAVAAVESIVRGEYVVVLRDGTKLNSSGSYRERLEGTLLNDS